MPRQQKIDKLTTLLLSLDGQIADLHHLLETETGAVGNPHAHEMEHVIERRHHAAKMLAQLELEEAESWREEEFVASVLAIFDDLGRRLNRIVSHVDDTTTADAGRRQGPAHPI